jgi:hypothetical protein
MNDAGSPVEKRRAGGAIRVPFVRRCHLEYPGGVKEDAFIVNINTLGAYVAREIMPPLGRPVSIRFQEPGSEREIAAEGVVAWKNPLQEHRVHSLPPGFGIAFRTITDDACRRIERIVGEYLGRQAAE